MIDAPEDLAPAPTRPYLSERGEMALLLDGVEMVMRPTYEAIIAFERATGKGLLQLARDALAGALTLGEVAQIACECIRAWGRDVEDKGAAGANPKRVADLILEGDGGLHKASVTVGALLTMASTGGYTAQGKPKPATTT